MAPPQQRVPVDNGARTPFASRDANAAIRRVTRSAAPPVAPQQRPINEARRRLFAFLGDEESDDEDHVSDNKSKGPSSVKDKGESKVPSSINDKGDSKVPSFSMDKGASPRAAESRGFERPAVSYVLSHQLVVQLRPQKLLISIGSVTARITSN